MEKPISAYSNDKERPINHTSQEILPKIGITFPDTAVIETPARTDILLGKLETHKEITQPIQPTENKQNEDTVLKSTEKLKLWLKYPPESDTLKIKDKIYAPAFFGTVTGLVLNTLIANPTFLSYLVAQNQAIPYLQGSMTLLLSSGATLLFSIMLNDKIVKNEHSNRIHYSNLVTVSRAFINKNSKLRPAFKAVDRNFDTGFIGEVNFVGTNPSSWSGITTESGALKDGAKGLYQLALACERGDPNLNGIHMFGGISHMLNPRYEKLGFKIFAEEEFAKKPTTRKIFDFLNKFKDEKRYSNGAIQKEQLSYGIITRESLIRNKDMFAKLSRLNITE